MAERSTMTTEWIQRVWEKIPCVKLDDIHYRTGPVRLAFANILERGKPMPPKTEGSFGAVLLFPEGADISILKLARKELVTEKAPAALTNEAILKKLNNPFKDQGDFVNSKSPTGELYDGFVAGRACISANSNSQPQCVDQRMVPVTDKKDVYSGCWVIPILTAKWFDVGTNKGPTFYLDSVMVVAHDENIGGTGGVNVNKAFAGVEIDADVNPAAAFGETVSAADLLS